MFKIKSSLSTQSECICLTIPQFGRAQYIKIQKQFLPALPYLAYIDRSHIVPGKKVSTNDIPFFEQIRILMTLMWKIIYQFISLRDLIKQQSYQHFTGHSMKCIVLL